MSGRGRPYTVGLEEEYQLIEPETGELCELPPPEPGEPALVTAARVNLKREFHTCAVEIDTGPCETAVQAHDRLARGRGALAAWCRERGRIFVAAGTHPYSDWRRSAITDAGRYLELVANLQDVGRGNLIFGLHVHVALPDPSRAVDIMGRAATFLPALLALSCSSPYWLGRETGLKSSRAAVFSRMPRTGVPPLFASLEDYQEYVTALVKTACIADPTRIWWDLRPHPTFPTLEFRICDMQPRLVDAVLIAALAQAVVARIDGLLTAGRAPAPSRRSFVEENKWRAARFGLRGSLVDFERDLERTPQQYIEDLLDFVDDQVDALGSRDYVERAQQLVVEGSSADRQVTLGHEAAGDLRRVVDGLVAETLEGVDEGVT